MSRGGLGRARLQIALAESKCSHYLSWRDMSECQSNNRSQWGGGGVGGGVGCLFVCFFVTSLNFKPKLRRFT